MAQHRLADFLQEPERALYRATGAAQVVRRPVRYGKDEPHVPTTSQLLGIWLQAADVDREVVLGVLLASDVLEQQS